MRGATVSIAKNRTSGVLKVQPYAREYGTPQPFGSPTFLPRDASDEDIVQAVLMELKKTDVQKYDVRHAPRYSEQEQQEILKNEKTLTIVETPGGFRIIPLRRVRGSFASMDDRIEVIPAKDFPASGGRSIRSLFDAIP